MKKILTLLLLSSGIIGCSNIQLEAVSTSSDETQRTAEGTTRKKANHELAEAPVAHRAARKGQLATARARIGRAAAAAGVALGGGGSCGKGTPGGGNGGAPGGGGSGAPGGGG